MSTSTSSTDVRDVPGIGHREAMAITAVEDDRLSDALAELDPAAWAVGTDCTGWDVRALVVHLIGSAEAQASPVEFLRQLRAGRPLTAQIGGTHWVDGLNEAQLRARSHLPVDALPGLWRSASRSALDARRKMPAPLRALPLLPLGEALGTDLGWKPIGYLFSMGFTRDVWMHRVDLARAVGQPMALTADHDGRIVADIVAEWATLHTEPFMLRLSGPAGGSYRRGSGGEVVEIDAVEFCRVLSGRASGTGVLTRRLPL